MSNAMFDPGREGFALGEIDFDTAVIKAILVRGYTFSAAHKFVSDVTGAGATIHATSSALTSKTGTSGTLNSAGADLGSPAANATNHTVILIQSSAVTGGADVAATAQRVIAHFDTGTNFPIIPNGGPITVNPNASGWLKL
jgi:hypothetical protein